jgi:hypothetical protein
MRNKLAKWQIDGDLYVRCKLRADGICKATSKKQCLCIHADGVVWEQLDPHAFYIHTSPPLTYPQHSTNAT